MMKILVTVLLAVSLSVLSLIVQSEGSPLTKSKLIQVSPSNDFDSNDSDADYYADYYGDYGKSEVVVVGRASATLSQLELVAIVLHPLTTKYKELVVFSDSNVSLECSKQQVGKCALSSTNDPRNFIVDRTFPKKDRFEIRDNKTCIITIHDVQFTDMTVYKCRAGDDIIKYALRVINHSDDKAGSSGQKLGRWETLGIVLLAIVVNIIVFIGLFFFCRWLKRPMTDQERDVWNSRMKVEAECAARREQLYDFRY